MDLSHLRWTAAAVTALALLSPVQAHASAATADGGMGPAPSLEEIFLKLTSV
jgi:hypothetical protein